MKWVGKNKQKHTQPLSPSKATPPLDPVSGFIYFQDTSILHSGSEQGHTDSFVGTTEDSTAQKLHSRTSGSSLKAKGFCLNKARTPAHHNTPVSCNPSPAVTGTWIFC